MNSVRKLEGEVGELAKTLVMKWKDMVAADEKAEKMKPSVPLFSELIADISILLDFNTFFCRITN